MLPDAEQVASWGGYTFIINLLPIHCLACVFTGQLTAKLYIAFAPLILIGTIEAGEPTSRSASNDVATVSSISVVCHILISTIEAGGPTIVWHGHEATWQRLRCVC